jgi:hypothetical protein
LDDDVAARETVVFIKEIVQARVAYVDEGNDYTREAKDGLPLVYREYTGDETLTAHDQDI